MMLKIISWKYAPPKNDGRLLFQTEHPDFLENNTLEELIETSVESFQDRLFKMIKEKNLDEVEI